MSHIADMTDEGHGLTAVGWLDPDHPYTTGTVPQEFATRLKEFAHRWGHSIRALGWGAAGGFHTCEFCGKAWCSGTFGVPAGDRVFFVPEMIAHYVEQHGYAPPAEFITAVLACPLPGTPDYVSAVAPFALHHP